MKAIDKIGNLVFENLQVELMRARSETDKNPTDGQKEAGNYKKGHINIHGFNITIENPKGSYRSGKDKNGKPWKTLMHNDYGYFTRTLGKDGDAVDVFIGPNLDSDKIFPIDQYAGGEYDETKVMLGFNSAEDAKRAYLSNYEKDWKGFKYITEVSVDEFKKWLYNGRRQRKPFAKYKDMKKNIIKLNESTLRKIVFESVKKVINESMNANKKAELIISELRKLNFEERGHKIGFSDEFQEVSVTDMNVPANADCREIAERFGCNFYVDNSFNVGIFEV